MSADSKLKFTDEADYQASRLEFIERHASIAHLLISQSEFKSIFGEEPADAITNPGSQPPLVAAAGASKQDRLSANANFDRWKEHNTAYKEQTILLNNSKVDLISIMPIDVKDSLKEVSGAVAKGLLNKTPGQLLAALDARYATISAGTLNKIRSKLRTSCSADPTDIRRNACDHRDVFHIYDKASMGLSQHEQITIFSKTLPAQNFSLFLRFFAMKYPMLTDRKFETLVKEVLEEAETQASEGTTGNTANQAVANTPTVYANAHAAHGTSTSMPTPTYYYCWTHGLVLSPAHTSATCTHRHAGHDVTATMANYKKKGGKLSVWKKGDKPGP
jgi:hypothetical protein